MNLNRRTFIKNTALASVAAPVASCYLPKNISDQSNDAIDVHIFSKHLQFLNYKETGQITAELGFAGVDLTVRPKGHVLPERVQTDLAVAIKDIAGSGSSCEMITTAISDINNPMDVDVITEAGKSGIKYYRSNWFSYMEEISLEESLEHYRKKVNQLGKLNEENNIIGCYQNHSGTKVGASVWEVKKILESANPKYFGAQYDIRHAVAEGGKSWPNGVKLLKDKIKTIVLKDFMWGEVDGEWKIINVPIGDGMVDFKKYFKLLKSYGLKPPVSLHLEYPLGGAEKGRFEISVDKSVVYKAMKKDLTKVQQLWKES